MLFFPLVGNRRMSGTFRELSGSVGNEKIVSSVVKLKQKLTFCALSFEYFDQILSRFLFFFLSIVWKFNLNQCRKISTKFGKERADSGWRRGGGGMRGIGAAGAMSSDFNCSRSYPSYISGFLFHRWRKRKFGVSFFMWIISSGLKWIHIREFQCYCVSNRGDSDWMMNINTRKRMKYCRKLEGLVKDQNTWSRHCYRHSSANVSKYCSR